MEGNPYKCKKCNVTLGSEVVNLFQSMDAKPNLCPNCGELYPQTINYILDYFRIIQLSEELRPARDLLLKSEMRAAVREALIQFESIVREKSGLDGLTGSDLMAKAFLFDYDTKTNTLTKVPKISVNDLSTLTKRNEQDGMKFISMGLMLGIRNLYMHTAATNKLYYCLQIITVVDLLLKQVSADMASIASSESEILEI